MTAVARVGSRPASPGDVVALQYGNRNRMLGIPLYILGGVVLLSVAIGLTVLRAGGDLDHADFNASVLYSVLGYTVAIGVQNVASSFPFALALGSTRRTFVLGNLVTAAAQAILVAVAAVVLLGIETATHGWFIGARTLSPVPLGSGDPVLLGGVMLLATLTALSVGGVFGSSYVRFGARGPLVLSLGLAALAVVLLLLLVPQAAAIAATFRPWWLAVGGAVVIGLSAVGQYLLLRRASVR
jgi:hypothetical protein